VKGCWLAVGGWLLAAAALRVGTLFYHDISGDDATVGLIARHVLAGQDFPVFFYRQAYMGTINGFHLVPALAVFGPSVLLVRLNAVLWSLLFPLGMYLLGRRAFDEATGRAALALAAVPPFLLTYWSSVAEPHFETNVFGVLLLLLVLAALRAEPGPRRVRVLLVFGLVAGAAWWTNFKALEILIPGLLVLALCRPRRWPGRDDLALGAGFLLGSLPAWLFYAGYRNPPGDPHRLLEAGLDLSLERAWSMLATVVPSLLGTYYWPALTPGRRVGLVAVGVVHAVAVAWLAVDAARGGWRADATVWGRRLLLLSLVVPFGLLHASRYVDRFDQDTSRYVLPVYIPLMVAAGALVARVARRARLAGVALLLGLLAFNVWTNAGFLWPLDPGERARRRLHVERREAIVRHLAAHPVDGLYLDEGGASLRWAFLWGRAPVSELTHEIYLPDAIATDAARRVGILKVTDDPSVASQLRAAGATYRATTFGPLTLFQDLRVPDRDWRPVPPAGWRVAGEGDGAPGLADGDLATASPRTAAAGREPVVVDLGGAYAVARVTWWPSAEWEHSLALLVSRSADGVGWERLGVLPSASPARRPTFAVGPRPFFRPRNGWLELRTEPRPVRYLRFAPVDPAAEGAWGVAELRVYEDLGPRQGAPADPTALASWLRDRGLSRLLADPATSAQVSTATRGAIRTRIANGVQNSHGAVGAPARLWDPVDLRETDGLLVPGEDAGELRERLAGEGLRFREERMGDGVLLYDLDPLPSGRCRPTRWRVPVTGSVRPDGTVTPSLVEARLDRPGPLVGVSIVHPLVGVRHVRLLAVAVSGDGRAWRPVAGVRRLGEWAWAGRTLFANSGGIDEVWWPATDAARVRLELAIPDTEGRSPITQVCLREARR
jgi:4-amino-4-deoxy-L-arabinose transferase-like glycosyltransferase